MIDKDIAKEDLNRWLDAKKIPISRRDESDKDIEALLNELVCAISEGSIIVTEDNEIIQLLKFPLNEPNKVTELKYISRITAGALQSKTSHIKKDDNQGKAIATIAALTGEVGGVIRALDSVDYSIAGCISAFY